jgi:hypothetical protein
MTYFSFFSIKNYRLQKQIISFVFFSKVISYYSRRGGLGGVSIINEKSDFSLLSQLLIRDANPDDQVITSSIPYARHAKQMGRGPNVARGSF